MACQLLKWLFSAGRSVAGDNRADFDILTAKYKELYDDMYNKQNERIQALERRVDLLEEELDDNETEREQIRQRELECIEINNRLSAELKDLHLKYEKLKAQINNQ